MNSLEKRLSNNPENPSLELYELSRNKIFVSIEITSKPSAL
jgi:hypothetical protein